MGSVTSDDKVTASRLGLKESGFAYPQAYTLTPAVQQPDDLPFRVPPSHTPTGTGILTCFPSATPFGLALGTDSPWED